MRAFYLAACLLLCAIPAYAQSFEAGASIAASCRGSEGSLCYESGLATFGPYASIWFADRIELGVRAVWLKRDDYQVESGNSPDDAFALTDRSRLVAQGEFIWHFRRGKRARPMVGFGAGVFRDRDVVTCDSPTCRVWIPSSMVGPGEYTTLHHAASIVGGLSVDATPRVRIRGGWRVHNLGGEELQLSELFAAVGYRF